MIKTNTHTQVLTTKFGKVNRNVPRVNLQNSTPALKETTKVAVIICILFMIE